MFYGPSFEDMYHRAATYVDRILRGARPGELPVEQPTKFELVINLKAAGAFGSKSRPLEAPRRRGDRVRRSRLEQCWSCTTRALRT